MHEDVMLQQVAIAAIVSKVLEWLKRSQRVPWFSAHSDMLNRWVSVLIAIATSVGFVFGWTGTLEAGATLTIMIPPLATLVEFALHAVFSFTAQESAYRGLIKR